MQNYTFSQRKQNYHVAMFAAYVFFITIYALLNVCRS